jgi:hypothetical protein
MKPSALRDMVIFLVFLLAYMFYPAKTGEARSSSPMTVYQYFLLLPSEFFFEDYHSSLQRTDMIVNSNESILDNRHEYLYVPGGDGQSYIEMAVFKYKGMDTVAVRAESYDPFIPFMDFFRCKNGKLVDVTKQVMPVRFNPNYNWALPERGTKIIATSPKGKEMVQLSWINGRFVSDKLR